MQQSIYVNIVTNPCLWSFPQQDEKFLGTCLRATAVAHVTHVLRFFYSRKTTGQTFFIDTLYSNEPMPPCSLW